MTTTTAAPKPVARKIESTDTIQGRYGQTIELSRYEVTVEGRVVGEVYQTRAGTQHDYANTRLGYSTERTVWASTEESWEEYATRKEAIAGLVKTEARNRPMKERIAQIAAEREAARPAKQAWIVAALDGLTVEQIERVAVLVGQQVDRNVELAEAAN